MVRKINHKNQRKIAGKKRAVKRRGSKRGVSEIVSYVLLIVIAISISALVYAFLSRIPPQAKNTCPDEVSLIIKDHCFKTSNNGEVYINITLENKGTYTVDAVNIKVAKELETSSKKVIPTYLLGGGKNPPPYETLNPDLKGTTYLGINGLSPGREKSLLLDYTEYGTITKVQITPIVFQAKSREKATEFIFCNKAIIVEDVDVITDKVCPPPIP